MTPLAQKMVKQLTLPVAKRSFTDLGIQRAKQLEGAICFETSAVEEVAIDIVVDLHKKETNAVGCMFLPAPKTWIEFTTKSAIKSDCGSDVRIGVLIEAEHGAGYATCRWTISTKDRISFNPAIGRLPLNMNNISDMKNVVFCSRFLTYDDAEAQLIETKLSYILYGFLALINTPQIIGRRTHQPHKGLKRDLLAQQKSIGKFPLQAWTEIILEVTPPTDEHGEPWKEGHLTGRKALHFVRSHCRVVNGKTTIVVAHWRGDGALGIKRSRYKVKPSRAGAATPMHV